MLAENASSENGYFYATPAGRQELCKLANFRRMAVVIQRRCFEGSLNKKGKTLDEIKTDLNSVIMDFAPSYLRTSQSMDNVPYLSIGDEEEQISKKILESFESEISGIFDVSETSYSENGNCRKFRHLTFRSNANVIQSEIRLLNDKELDWSSLASLHHRSIVASLAISSENFLDAALNICLVGLGGGCLATFLRRHFPKVNTTVVELDPMILNAAERWFDFKQDELMQCYVDDGVEFFKKKAANKEQTPQYDVIILDVSGSTSFEGGLTCPPPIFLTEECIGLMKKILRHSGAVALNLTVRCPEKSAEIKKRFDENFGTVLSHRISDDIVNELLICLPYKPPNMSDFNILVQDRLSKLHDYLSLICNNSSATREKEEYKKKIVQNDSPQTLKCGVQEIMDKIVKI